MKNHKNTIFYFVVTGGFTALIYWIIGLGKALETNKNIIQTIAQKGHWNDFIDSLTSNLHHPLAILLAQIITIIIVARVIGWIFR
jgi:hypothetical protein